MPTHTPKPRAFTLIELLVSISIIALLIGLAVPALGSARETSRRVKCLANLRSFGQAFATYLNDSKSVLPEVRPLQDAGGTDQDKSLLDVMANYLSVNMPVRERPGDANSPFTQVADVFKCPADRAGLDAQTNFEPVWRSFGTSYDYFAGRLMLGAELGTVPRPARAVSKVYELPQWRDLPVMTDWWDWHDLRRGQIARNQLFYGDWRADWATGLAKVLDDTELRRRLICDIVRVFGGVPIPDCN